MFGTFHETIHFQLLTGIHLGFQNEIFWTYFISIIFILYGMAFLFVSVKKLIEKFKDRHIIERINIQLSSPLDVKLILYLLTNLANLDSFLGDMKLGMK